MTDTHAVYSPSQTTTYLDCPAKHSLSRVEGWRPKVLSKRDAAAIVGQAFAAGVEVWNHRRIPYAIVDAATVTASSAGRIAEIAAQESIRRLLVADCVVPAVLHADFEYAPTLAARAVERVCADDPIPASWTIVDVERPFPDHGNARPDLVCREEDGALTIVDYKVQLSGKDSWVAERLDTYRRSWQMYHYVHAARAVYGAPVERYAIVLVRLEPWRVVLQPYTVDERALHRWRHAAIETWFRMHCRPVGGPAAHWTACETKYGACEFLTACWDHDRDEALMALDYVRVPRQEEAA